VTVITESELSDLARDVLAAAGASPDNAAIVAQHLVEANLSGVDTHGVWHLPGYVKDLRAGLIDGSASPEVLERRPTSALVTGHWTFGQVAARYATEIGIELAAEHDVAVVGLVQVWAGGYSEEAPMTMPYGGRERLLHTNPISISFPAGDEPRVMFDFATTTLSGVKIDNAKRRGESVQPGAIVDRDGQPTTDPNAFFDGGGHVAFGGHKGYAIGYAAEFFGRIFTGSNTFADPDRAGPVLRNQGVTFIFIRADLFRPMAEFTASADEMERRTRAVAPVDGVAGVLVPGDPEWRSRATRRRDGIPVEDALWERLAALPRSADTTPVAKED